MIEPKEIEIKNSKGELITYIIHKFPAVEGREIIAKYPLSSLPKLGEYAGNEEIMLKLMSYVSAVKEVDGKTQIYPLKTKAMINNHVDSWETLLRIEAAILEYNCSFFQNGRILDFLKDSAPKLQAWISKILTDSLAPLSQKEKPLSTS